MIDRKTLCICVTVFIVATVATLWRLSTFPDWQHVPVSGPGGHTLSWPRLFILPACLLLVTARSFGRKWFASGPEESIELWRRWSAAVLLPYCAVTIVLQGFILVRPSDYDAVAQGITVLMGILLIMLGNLRPKLPWLSLRIALFRLAPWQGKRHLRLNGRLMMGLGLVIVIGEPVLPPEWFRAICLAFLLAMVTASIAYRIKLRRELSPS